VTLVLYRKTHHLIRQLWAALDFEVIKICNLILLFNQNNKPGAIVELEQMLFLTLFYLDTLKITQLLSMIRLKPETNNFGFNYSDDKLKTARKCYIRMVICSILRNLYKSSVNEIYCKISF
jgi:hypothetical protein